MSDCPHPLAEIQYRVTSLPDEDYLNPEVANSDWYESWTCNARDCILSTVKWATPKAGMQAFMYTRDHKPISLEEALKGAK